MKKKLNKVQIIRHLVQLGFFFILPGLYIMAFSELKELYKMIIGGSFNLIEVLPSFIQLTAIFLTTIIIGRFFCGWICLFGMYNDFIYEISKRLFKKKFKIDEEVDSILKYVKYIILIFLIIFVWTMGNTSLTPLSPWEAFAQIPDFSTILSSYFLGFIILILITIGSLFIERFFCRYLCPLGAVFNIISRFSIFKINKKRENCGKCKMCTINCSMGIPLYKIDEVKGRECINCLKCVEVCPRSNAKANILNKNIDATMASSMAVATFAGIYSLNTVGVNAIVNTGISSPTTITSSQDSNSIYKDETYEGTGIGYINETTTSETKTEAATPATQVAKTPEVTTPTTNKTTTVPAPVTTPKTTTPAPTPTTQKYKDGTYQGSGTGYKRGTTTLSITIKGGKITSINTISSGDTPEFYNRASGIVISGIIKAQSSTVSTVSGATFTSNGIMSGVKDALSKALV